LAKVEIGKHDAIKLWSSALNEKKTGTSVKHLSAGFEESIEARKKYEDPVDVAVDGLKKIRDKEVYSIPTAIKQTDRWQATAAKISQIYKARKAMKGPHTDVIVFGMCNYDEVGTTKDPLPDEEQEPLTQFRIQENPDKLGYFAFDFSVLLNKNFENVLLAFSNAMNISKLGTASYKYVNKVSEIIEKAFGDIKMLHEWLHIPQEINGKIRIIKNLEVKVVVDDPQCKIEVETFRCLLHDEGDKDTEVYEKRPIEINRSYDSSKRKTKDRKKTTSQTFYINKQVENVPQNDAQLTRMRSKGQTTFTTALLPEVRIWFPKYVKKSAFDQCKFKIKAIAHCETYDPALSAIKDINALEMLHSYEERLKLGFANSKFYKETLASAKSRVAIGANEEIAGSLTTKNRSSYKRIRS